MIAITIKCLIPICFTLLLLNTLDQPALKFRRVIIITIIIALCLVKFDCITKNSNNKHNDDDGSKRCDYREKSTQSTIKVIIYIHIRSRSLSLLSLIMIMTLK